ncbi:Gfo/Idh/MocA family protein [Roseibium sp.]|uniref:Gfo/Idh/MocA family protein n=1 Tax=Roseibium sp. TaxID=1936156 RepID=UPI003A979434
MRIGIIGCGAISESYIQSLPRFRGMEINACADLNRGMAERLSNAYGIRRLTVTDLLQAPDVDLVLNLTSADAHYAVGREVLLAGKHLYSEKPLALTFEQARTLQDLAVKHRRGLGVAPDTFLTAPYQQARAILESGQLGKVSFATCRVMNRGAESRRHPHIDTQYYEGQGPLVHQGPYCISTLVSLFGAVQRVSALSLRSEPVRRARGGNGEELVFDVKCQTTYQALLVFENELHVSLTLSWDVWSEGSSAIEIFGTQGALKLPDPSNYTGALELSMSPGGAQQVRDDESFYVAGATTQKQAEDFYRGLALADMIRALREGGAYRCSDFLGVHVVEVLEAIDQAAQDGSVLEMKTGCISPQQLTTIDVEDLLA